MHAQQHVKYMPTTTQCLFMQNEKQLKPVKYHITYETTPMNIVLPE